jgi:carbon storage regulator
MLVLTRKYGQKIMIGDDIVITVLEGRGDSIRIGIEAPPGVSVKRAEVYQAVSAENLAAVEAGAGAANGLREVLNLLGAAPLPRDGQPAPDPASAAAEARPTPTKSCAPTKTGPGEEAGK